MLLAMQALLSPETAKPVVEALLTVVVGAVGYLNKKGDAKTRLVVTERLAEHAARSETRFDDLALELRDLKGIVVGPDGRNGMRGRQDEIKQELGRISVTLNEKNVGDGRIDERMKGVEGRVAGLEQRERAE